MYMPPNLVTLEELQKNNIISEDFVFWLRGNGFLGAPASANHHGNFTGGLYSHSQVVTHYLLALDAVPEHPWTNSRSPYIVGMFHDLCKIDSYKPQNIDEYLDGLWVKDDKTILTGHGEKSVMLLSQFMTLTEEEVLCIRYHMGAYIKEDWDGYRKAIRKYPNVLYTHMADMLASTLIV